MTDFYEILGIPKTASSAEVRQAYARLARERHPDRFPDPAQKANAQEFFKVLTTAFNALSRTQLLGSPTSERRVSRVSASLGLFFASNSATCPLT